MDYIGGPANPYVEAYMDMAELDYRPGAPNDGFGNITIPVAELDLEAEAMEWALEFYRKERADHGSFWIGCPDHRSAVAFALTIEAARLLCGAEDMLAERLLRRAVSRLDEARPNVV